jgi:2-phospho-L-lactate guanylyltransferase
MKLSSTVAIIPVRFLPQAKHRLATSWNATSRQELVQAMLRDVITATEATTTIDERVIVTCDATLPDEFTNGNVKIHQSRITGLNSELKAYIDHIKDIPGTNILIILADLPFLTGDIVDEIVTTGQRTQRPVIAPDWKGSGTNILFCPLPIQIELCFGNHSFQRFQTGFEKVGLKPIIYHAAESALDIDDDLSIDRFFVLAQYGSKRKLTHTYRFLTNKEKKET